MMLPSLISVSVAPGSYFFWAEAGVVTSTAAASMARAARFWRRPGIDLSPMFCSLVLLGVSQGGLPLASASIFRGVKRRGSWDLDAASQQAPCAPVNHQQRAADDDRACDLAQRDWLTEHQPSQEDGRYGNEQRHQHDIG